MRNRLLPFALFFLAASVLSAQDYDREIAEKCVDGLIRIGTSILSDSFSPMTNFHKGDLVIIGVPAFVAVPKAYDDGDVVINGKELWGVAGGIGGGYAATDRWMVFGVLSGMSLVGQLEEDSSGYAADTTYSFISLTVGAGFDLLRTDRISWPLYAGWFLGYHSFQLDFNTVTDMGVTFDASASGSGVLSGFIVGSAFTLQLTKKLSVTPYLLGAFSFQIPIGKVEWDWTSPIPPFTGSGSDNLEFQPVTSLLLGMNGAVDFSKEWNLSLNTGTLVSSLVKLNDLNGQKGLFAVTIVLTVTWTHDGRTDI